MIRSHAPWRSLYIIGAGTACRRARGLLVLVVVLVAAAAAAGARLEVELAGEHPVEDLVDRAGVDVAPQLLALELLEGPVDPLVIVVASHAVLLEGSWAGCYM